MSSYGEGFELEARRTSTNFAKPEWQAKVNGLAGAASDSGIDGRGGLEAGSIDLDLSGHNCKTTPAAAQKRPHFWERQPSEETKPSSSVLPPDPDCVAGYLLVGKAKIHNACVSGTSM